MMERNSSLLSQNGSQIKSFLLYGNEDVFAAFVCDFALLGVNERRKSDAEKGRNGELFHACGALTDGKRPFLIRRFKFFPSMDIR